MACDELTQGMASTGHILLGNHTVDLTKGPAPMSTFSRGPNFHPRGLYHVAHGGHTLKTTLEGCILEFTYIRGPAQSLVTDRGKDFYPGNRRPVAATSF